MTFGDDERAQSTLVGAILLFAILIIAFSSYQAFVVPNQNAEVEFDHNLGVQSDMQDLRNSLLDVRSVERIEGGEYAVVSEHRSARLRLGTQFPARLIALNPPAPSGTLTTTEHESGVQIENAAVKNPDNFDPDADLSVLFDTHETKSIVYRPSYSEYRSSPSTVLEHSLLYNDAPETDLVVREQNVVNTDRNRINIVLFEGSIDRSGSQAVTLDPETLDGPTAPVPIESDGGDITLRLPTDSREVWDEQIDGLSGASVDEAESSDEEVVIELEDDEYTLRMATVGFDSDSGAGENQFTPIQPTEPDPEGVEVDPAYEVVWDTGVMDEEDEFECNEDRCEIAIEDRGDTAIETDPSSVAGFAEFAVIDGTVGEFRDGYFEEFEDGAHRHEFEALEIGETEIVVLAGDDRDELEIEVYGQGDLEGTVFDADDGTEIEGATVTVEETGASDTTDAGGEYGIEDIRTGTYDVTAEADGYESDTSSVEINHDEITVQDFTLQPAAGFEVTITDTNSPVTEGETLEVDATIENMGDEEDTQDIELLDFDDTVVDTEGDLTLGAGDSEDVRLQWDTEEGDAGSGDITVRSEDDEDTEEVTIDALEPDPAEPDLSNLDIAGQGTDATITEGEPGDVEIEVENVGEESGAFTIELEITNGETVEETETTEELDPGETETVIFEDPLSGLSGDTYDVTVADEDEISSVSGTLTVQTPPTVQTDPATSVSTTEATLNGELTDLGTADEVDVSFEYRQTGATEWIETDTQTRETTGTFDETITGLDSGTEYEFRAVAESADGSDTGDILTFTTEEDLIQFDVLEGEVTDTRGGGTEATEVTFTYTLSSDAPSVTFEVEDGLGNVNTEPGPNSGGEEHQVEIDTSTAGSPEDNYPLTLTAEIEDGECYTAIIEEEGDNPTLADGDWSECE